jgi:hypothetical protein
MPPCNGHDPDSNTARERKRRNVAVALVLAGLAVLFYVMTMVRIQP